jgi:hypothetical protein
VTNRLSPRVIAAAYALGDIERYSRHVVGRPLYPYQVAPLRAIIDSVMNR